MAQGDSLAAIGLMSGTSMDGVDVALLWTDGQQVLQTGPSMTLPYDDSFREQLRGVMGRTADAAAEAGVTAALTARHAEAIKNFVKRYNINIKKIDIIGFHGQTTLHQPDKRLTVQIGDGDSLAREFGIPVAWDFRTADVESGGQGAPFAPLFHAALCAELQGPVAVVNIGGVANATWIGGPDEILAFDTGPGNGPIDDWVASIAGEPYDDGGMYAFDGAVDVDRVKQALVHPYFQVVPPKSLDRKDFGHEAATGLELCDGAATLTEISVASIAMAARHFPRPVRSWVVCGGGRHNAYMMERLAAYVEPAELLDCDELGWNGDALEAQAFGYLAVRVVRGLPLSLPTTTGVPRPMPGGRLSKP